MIRWLAPALAGVLMIPAAASAAEPKADPAPVERAQDRVAEAKADLREATATAQRLRTDADTAEADAERAEQDLSTIAREAYRGGALDVIGIATLFDSPNPSDAMRRAAVVELLAEHQDSQVAEALKGSDIALGAQDCATEAKGAYTGEIAASMIARTCISRISG